MILLCGHFSGFEWMFIIDRYIKSNFYAVYKRLRNKYFDKSFYTQNLRIEHALVQVNQNKSDTNFIVSTASFTS